jgi:RNA polymerase sigma-54 factor
MQLEQRIKEELEANPVLEEESIKMEEEPDETSNDSDSEELSLSDYIGDDDLPNYKTTVNNAPKEERKEYSTLSNSAGLHQLLEEQLAFQDIDDRQRMLGAFIIGSIDHDGYLRRNLSSISDDIAFKMSVESTIKELEEILGIIQTFDPPGVGARTLKECLAIQLRNKEQTSEIQAAGLILKSCFEDLSRKRFARIALKLEMDEELIRDAIQEILKLNPKPGAGYENQFVEQLQQVIPDFIIESKSGKPELTLNSYNLPELRLHKGYSEMIERYSNKRKLSPKERETVNFVKQKIDSAKWFIDSIKQRHETLMSTMNAIVKFQSEYFRTGNESDLSPMILKDIAEPTGLDISTISRVVNSKYVQCDWGIFPLKFLFSEGFQSETGEVSIREVKKIILECIENEDKQNPLKDDEIREILINRGYPIARRTVAKYREKLNIPVSRMRREL